MKSIEMTQEAYVGIPADVAAFTLDDEKRWFESQDVSCMPAVIATLKGLRALVSVTGVAIHDEADADISTLTLAVGESAVVKASRTPVYANKTATWSSSDAEKVTATALDESRALVKRLAEGTVTVTVTGASGVTDTLSVN